MKYYILIILLLITACSSFERNESGLRRACKSGVVEYDDGALTFTCQPKEKK